MDSEDRIKADYYTAESLLHIVRDECSEIEQMQKFEMLLDASRAKFLGPALGLVVDEDVELHYIDEKSALQNSIESHLSCDKEGQQILSLFKLGLAQEHMRQAIADAVDHVSKGQEVTVEELATAVNDLAEHGYIEATDESIDGWYEAFLPIWEKSLQGISIPINAAT